MTILVILKVFILIGLIFEFITTPVAYIPAAQITPAIMAGTRFISDSLLTVLNQAFVMKRFPSCLQRFFTRFRPEIATLLTPRVALDH